MRTAAKTDAPGSPRIDFLGPMKKAKPFTENQRFSTSATLTRFQQELDYYRADAPYLTAEKCVERCRMLSALLTAAVHGN